MKPFLKNLLLVWKFFLGAGAVLLTIGGFVMLGEHHPVISAGLVVFVVSLAIAAAMTFEERKW